MKFRLFAPLLSLLLGAAPLHAAEPLPMYDPATAGGAGNFNTSWAGFPACWNQRQKQFAATRDADKGAIVFFGDSLTELAPLTKLFPGLPLANRGISGDTSRGMVFRLEDNVLQLAPRQLIILCGANDMVQPGASATGTAENVVTLCQTTHARFPAIPIAVLEILPKTQAGAETVAAFNRELDRALAPLSYVTRVRSHAPFLKPDGSPDAANFRDGVHPNAKGYEVFRACVAPLLPKPASP